MENSQSLSAGQALFKVGVDDQTAAALDAITMRFERFGSTVSALLKVTSDSTRQVNAAFNEMLATTSKAAAGTIDGLASVGGATIKLPKIVAPEMAEVSPPASSAGAWTKVSGAVRSTANAIKQLSTVTAEMASEVVASTNAVAAAMEDIKPTAIQKIAPAVQMAGTAYGMFGKKSAEAASGGAAAASATAGASAAFSTVASRVSSLVSGLGRLIMANPKVTAAVLATTAAIAVFWPAIRPAVQAVGALIGVLGQVVGAFVKFSAGVVSVVTAPVRAVVWMAGTIVKTTTDIVLAVPRLLGAMARGVTSAITAIPRAVNAMVTGTISGLARMSAAVAAFSWKAITNPGQTLVAPIVNALSSAASWTQSKLQSIADSLDAFGDRVRGWGLKLGMIAGLVMAPLSAAANEFTKFANGIRKQANTADIAKDRWAALAFAAGEVGVSASNAAGGISEMNDMLERLQKLGHDRIRIKVESGADKQEAWKLQNPNQKPPEFGDTIADLGLSVSQLLAMNPEARFLAVAEAIAAMDDSTKRAAVAEAVFGAEAKKLWKVVADGRNGLEEYRREAESLGQIVSPEDTENAKRMATALDTMKTALKGVAIQAGAAVAEAIAQATERATNLVKLVILWIRENRELITTAFKVASVVASIAGAIAGLGTVISGVGAVFGVLASIVGGIGTVISVVGGAIAAILTPIGLLIAVASALGITLAAWVNPLRLVAAGVDGLRATFANFRDNATSSISAVMVTFAELKTWIGDVMNGIHAAIAARDVGKALAVAVNAGKVAWIRALLEIQNYTSQALGGILSALASGDFGGAWEQLKLGFRRALAEGIQAALPYWVQFMDLVDSTITMVRQGWNTALEALAKGIRVVGQELAAILDAAAAYDPTGSAQKAADAVRKAINSKPIIGMLTGAENNDKLAEESDKRKADRAIALQKALADQRAKLATLEQESAAAAALGQSEAQAKLDATRRELQEAIAAAQQAAEDEKKTGPAEAARQSGVTEFETSRGGKTAQGGFGGAAAAMLANQALTDKREIREANRRKEKLLSSIDENMKKVADVERLATFA